MRRLAVADRSKNNIKRVMVHDTDEGCFIYSCDTLHDRPCIADEWYPTVEEAIRSLQGIYVSEDTEWEQLPDPPAGCQHDLVRPSKLVRDEAGDILYREAGGKLVFDRRQPCRGPLPNKYLHPTAGGLPVQKSASGFARRG